MNTEERRWKTRGLSGSAEDVTEVEDVLRTDGAHRQRRALAWSLLKNAKKEWATDERR